jgi:Flp pilus assembly protein TadD
MRRVVIVLAVAGSLLSAAPRARARQALELNAMEMLDLYERRRELALTGFGTSLHADSVYAEVTREGKKWVAAKGPKEVERRRLVLATFVLEIVERLASDREQTDAEKEIRAMARSTNTLRSGDLAGLTQAAPSNPRPSAMAADTEWGVAMRLVNWVRQQLVDQRTPAPLEMVWHQAFIGLIEYYCLKEGGAPNTSIIKDLQLELEYVRDRYPKEPQFLLAWAWGDYWDYRPAAESMLWPEKMDIDHLWDTWEIPFLHSAEGYYAAALATPATAAEAKVRIAELRLKRHDADGALAILRDVDATSRDREVRYLSSLEQGWAYDLNGDGAKAIESFRRALAFLPDAQTASIALAGALMIDGRPDEASDITDRALTAHVLDPWIFHRYPAFQHYPDLMNRLREELK